MNPSTNGILRAVEAVSSDMVVILPNNKNVVLTAQQVESLTNKNVKVVPTETVVQGVAAMVAFNPEEDFKTNIQSMTEAKSTVETIEITRATHSTRMNGLNIEEGQAIGILDGKLIALDDKADNVLCKLLTGIDVHKTGIITIYYGVDANATEAEQVSA